MLVLPLPSFTSDGTLQLLASDLPSLCLFNLHSESIVKSLNLFEILAGLLLECLDVVTILSINSVYSLKLLTDFSIFNLKVSVGFLCDFKLISELFSLLGELSTLLFE